MAKTRLKELARREAEHLLIMKPSSKPWHTVCMAALTISSTILIGALMGYMPLGVLASLGAMIILNFPSSGNLIQRQFLLMALGIIMTTNFGLGLIAQGLPELRVPIFALITFCMVVMGRYFKLPPPGGLFIMMASVIAVFIPLSWQEMPFYIGVVGAGAFFSWIMALLYNLIIIHPSATVEPYDKGYEPDMLTESMIVTFFVVVSLEIALSLGMSYPYWVPVSCYIVLQGINLRTVWVKQLHRLLGTAIGVFVAWFLLSLSLSPVGVAVAIFLMFFWIESLVARHYALAVVMITPLTIFIAEYGRSHSELLADTNMALIQARFLDTLLGCSVALLGALIMHSKYLRAPLKVLESRVISSLKG